MFSKSVWDYAARPELKIVLSKLSERFGDRFLLLDSDPEWLYFQVTGMTDFSVIHLLEQEQRQFFGEDLEHYQIMIEQTGKERGVSIRYLPDAAAIQSSSPGFWYY
jgi:hypothetical protein